MPAPDVGLQVVLKVAARCNLNCSYCYVYNKGDTTWRGRPALMSDEVFTAALLRVRRHCERSGQPSVTLTFHGGEPCLLGARRFAAWCGAARASLEDLVRVHLCLQTNGTLLDAEWAEVLAAHRVDVGVSLDGPPDLHDAHRVDHAGRGSYDAVVRGMGVLREAGIPLQILSVIQPGGDGVRIHRHFLELGASTINYLLPDFTHDTVGVVRRAYGETPCADYLIPVFDEWWYRGSLEVRVMLFWNIARVILGGESETDLLGNAPLRFVFVETDGALEALDVLRVCGHGMAATGLTVHHDDFTRIAEASPLHNLTMFTGAPLPTACRGCPEESTCAGGYLPHRYSHARAFDNPTVWCPDLLRLFAHVRSRLGVSSAETRQRKQLLGELSASPTARPGRVAPLPVA